MSVLWYRFSEAVCCKASGKDARRYLNNRLSNDLRSLEVGQSTLAAALSAQGRVEALCTVFADAAETFYLVTDGGRRQTIVAALGRFIVADRISLEDVSASIVFLHVVAPLDVVLKAINGVGGDCFTRLSNRLGTEGIDLLVAGGDSASVCARLEQAFGNPLASDAYNLLRFRQGQPVFPEEVNEKVVLTECGMRSAVSFSKGCYVGQEVIERSDAIGRLPRRLERLKLVGRATVDPDAPIVNARGEAIGRVVTSACDEEASSVYVFALLKSGSYSIGDPISACGLTGEILSMEQQTT